MEISKIDHQSYIKDESELVDFRDRLKKSGAEKYDTTLIDRQIQRISMLKKIHQLTGLQFDVGKNDDNQNVAAFVEPENGFKPTIIEETLELSEDQVLKIAEHEKIHIESKTSSLNPEKFLESEQYQILLESLQIKELTEHDLIEGFTDAITNQRKGKNEISAYQHREVPIAEKLEKLAKEKLKISFFDLFSTGQKEELIENICRLADILLIEKIQTDLHSYAA